MTIRTFSAMIATLGTVSLVQAQNYADLIEGIFNPLLTSGSGWNVQAGADGSGASVSILEKSPLNGSLASLRQVGGLVVPSTQRIWKNFTTGGNPVTLNSGVYVWEWDFKAIRNQATNTYILRNRLEGANNDFMSQIATIGLVINPTDGVVTYGGVHPMLADYPGGSTFQYQFFATELTPNKWYRCVSYLDFNTGVHTGPTIIDISAGTTENYVIVGNASGRFNPNPSGGFYAVAQCSTFGAGAGCPIDEGWYVDNQSLTKGHRLSGTVNLEGVARRLDLNETAISVLFVGVNGSIAAAPVVPTLNLGEGTFHVVTKPGSYDVYVFGQGFLSKKIATNLMVSDDVVVSPFVLKNGDIDGDDVVSIFDYIQMSNAFDSTVNGPGGNPTAFWNPKADLDRDGVVSVFDYIIMSDNFDGIGEYSDL